MSFFYSKTAKTHVKPKVFHEKFKTVLPVFILDFFPDPPTIHGPYMAKKKDGLFFSWKKKRKKHEKLPSEKDGFFLSKVFFSIYNYLLFLIFIYSRKREKKFKEIFLSQLGYFFSQGNNRRRRKINTM